MSARRAIDLRRNNSATILRLLLDEGPLPRVELASRLSLSTGALTRITAEMSEHGLIRELDPIASSEAGRRPVPVDVRAEGFAVVGVHIGLELTTSGVVDLRGRPLGEPQVAEHGPLDARGAIRAAFEASRTLTDQMSDDVLLIGTGMISGGFVSQDWQVMADATALGWKGENVGELARELNLSDFVIDNAYRAHSRAEMWFGAARNVRDFIEFFSGNLIGAAVVVGGEFYSGRGRAPYVAHLPVRGRSEIECWCGRKGCLASVAGREATVARAQRAGLEVASVGDIARLARNGDNRAGEILRRRIDSIGEAISILIDVYDPDKVVLAGSISSDKDVDRIRTAVSAHSDSRVDPDDVVVPTALGDSATANVVAAATARLAEFYTNPLDSVLALRSRRPSR